MDSLIDVSSKMARIKRVEPYTDAPLLFADDEQYSTQELSQAYSTPSSEYLDNVPTPQDFRSNLGAPGVFDRDLQQNLPSTQPPAPVVQQQTVTTSQEKQKWKVMGMTSYQFLIFTIALCTGCMLLSFIVSMMGPSTQQPMSQLL
jgi:hypothetical protein